MSVIKVGTGELAIECDELVGIHTCYIVTGNDKTIEVDGGLCEGALDRRTWSWMVGLEGA